MLEQRFDRGPDGSVWTPNAYARPFWNRYLTHFDAVSVVARAREVENPDGQRVDGDGVEVHTVPHYVGPVGFVQQRRAVRQAVHASVLAADAVVLRAPGTLSNVAFSAVRRSGKPYAVEVVGDPHDVFAPGVVTHPARALFRHWYASSQRRQCASATVAAYVTEHALQRRYPPGPATWSTFYSDVELAPDAYAQRAREPRAEGPFVLVTVASLDQPYKAVDVQLDALRRLRADGLDVTLRVVGDGRLRATLEALAADLGVAEATTFLGGLPGATAVRAELDRADLFLIPSRTEGLPRALVEAMARGLPAIGSQVGGIPELLPPDALVPPGDAEALALRVRDVLAGPEARRRMGARNLERSRAFAEHVLAARREEAYARLREAAGRHVVTPPPRPR